MTFLSGYPMMSYPNMTWYFTAPWEPVMVRRGDALGFRASADYFADLLAPGLSNATSDARWISLLSWCLKWSHVAWQKAGGGDLTSRDGQLARYAWLRPLELFWVDRTLESGQTTGQLRGRRSVERWRTAERRLRNFAMSDDQFHRYRQVGTYGAYRVILRTVPGLTMGDGWTPTDTALQLATLVNESLPKAVRLQERHFENGTKWGVWSQARQAEFWAKHCWNHWASNAKAGFLPTPDDKMAEMLPKQERVLLEKVLFSPESTRRVTAEVLAKAKGASSHADLCDVLANSKSLSKQIEPKSLASLPAFTRFADASMHVVREVWNEIKPYYRNSKDAPTVAKLAVDLCSSLENIRETAAVWLKSRDRLVLPHVRVVTELAKTMKVATTPIDQLQALARHHEVYGGGRRWFREQAGKMIPLVADTGIAASDYRFRLRSLSRLAAQCGVAKMNDVLDSVERNELEPAARPELDDEKGDAT